MPYEIQQYPLPEKRASWFPLLLRLILGGIFLLAAWNKLRAPQIYAEAIGGFKLLHESVLLPAAVLFIWLEMMSGVSVLVGLWTRAGALLMSALLLIFFLAIAAAIARGLDIQCGCFGALASGGVGWPALLRALVLLVMAARLTISGGGRWCLAR